MKVLVKRINQAALSIWKNGVWEEKSAVGKGLLVFVGLEKEDIGTDVQALVEKIINLRVFPDSQGRFNYSLKDKNFGLMLIPNFTLCAKVEKGNRPSFEKATFSTG